MTIAKITLIITQLVKLILAGLALAEAVERVAKRCGVTERDVRRVWKATGTTLRDVATFTTPTLIIPRLVSNAVAQLVE